MDLLYVHALAQLVPPPPAHPSVRPWSLPSPRLATGSSSHLLRRMKGREEGQQGPSHTFERDTRSTMLPSSPHYKLKVGSNSRSCVYGVRYNRDGSLLAASEQRSTIAIFDSTKGYAKHASFTPNAYWAVTELGWVDNETLLYSTMGPELYRVKINRDLEGGGARGRDLTSSQEPLNLGSADFRVYSFAVAPGGAEVIAATSDGRLVLYSLERNTPLSTWFCHTDDINSVTYLSGEGGAADIIVSGSDDGLLQLSDRREAQKIAGVLPGHLCGISSVSSRGDGVYVCSSGKDQTVRVWDVRKALSAGGYSKPVSLAPFSFDYRWEAPPRKVFEVPHPADVSVATLRGSIVLRTLIRAKWSPLDTTGGRFIASGGAEGSLCIWDVQETGGGVEGICTLPKTTLIPHGPALIRDVSWHPSGSFLASGGFDGSVVVSGPRAGQAPKNSLERLKRVRAVLTRRTDSGGEKRQVGLKRLDALERPLLNWGAEEEEEAEEAEEVVEEEEEEEEEQDEEDDEGDDDEEEEEEEEEEEGDEDEDEGEEEGSEVGESEEEESDDEGKDTEDDK